MRIADVTTKEKAKAYLDSINYGNKRDYRKIYVNGMATNWASSLKVAKIAYYAIAGNWPQSVEFAN